MTARLRLLRRMLARAKPVCAKRGAFQVHRAGRAPGCLKISAVRR